MAEQDQINDQNIYTVVDKMIKDLLPFDQHGRLRAYRTVGTFFGFEDSYPKIAGNVDDRVSTSRSREPQFSNSEDLTPKEFLLQKQPNTDVERVACLAYYLDHYRDTPHFRTTDVSKLNTEAAQTKLSNASATVSHAIKTRYLATAAKGMKQLTAEGQQYVEALPDRDAAKEFKPRTSKRSRRKVRMSRADGNHGREQVKSNE